ncbi:MAG: hypothetical protein MK180_09420 [Rhodobacteraceae bacterium]|nr:hypothetical protein [Paracoccaceae bacterium]
MTLALHGGARLVVPSDIGDEVTAYPANAVEITIVGELADTMPESDVERLRKAAQLGAVDRGVRVVVDKLTPSMDASASLAAATLRAANRLTGAKLPPFPRSLEPDVAAAATVKNARLQGTMMSHVTLPPIFAVLIHSGHEAPYVPETGEADIPDISGLNVEETLNGLATLRNDAEPALREALPELEEVLDQLSLAPGCKFARAVGASTTCLGVFPDRATAVGAAALLADRYPAWWVASSQLK